VGHVSGVLDEVLRTSPNVLVVDDEPHLRELLVDALAGHLPLDCHWTAPRGGFFVWLRLPEGISSAEFLKSAEDAGVSYVPGTQFFVHSGGEKYCRLNFTMVSLDELEEGAHRLGSALSKFKP